MERKMIVGLLLIGMAESAWATETPKPETKADTSAALKTCEQRVTVLEQTLNGLAQGIQKELEITGLRLKAHLPPVEASR